MANRYVLPKVGLMTVSLSRAAIAGGVIFLSVACARPASVPTENNAEGMTSAPVPEGTTTVFGPPRLTPSEVERFLKRAQRGDVDAMYTLSTHHFANSEIGPGYHWLREAAKLGECHAILHLVENTFRGVTPREMPHWRKEKERLGCDPERDERAKPIIRIRPNPEPER